MSPEEADAELDAIEAETPGLKERVATLLAKKDYAWIQSLAFEPNPEDLN
jgi:hypothetical protein